jgi:hypothetical protein
LKMPKGHAHQLKKAIAKLQPSSLSKWKNSPNIAQNQISNNVYFIHVVVTFSNRGNWVSGVSVPLSRSSSTWQFGQLHHPLN